MKYNSFKPSEIIVDIYANIFIVYLHLDIFNKTQLRKKYMIMRQNLQWMNSIKLNLV